MTSATTFGTSGDFASSHLSWRALRAEIERMAKADAPEAEMEPTFLQCDRIRDEMRHAEPATAADFVIMAEILFYDGEDGLDVARALRDHARRLMHR